MASIEEVVEEYREIVEEKIVDAEAAKRKLDQLIELQKIENERVKGERLTDDDAQRAMSLLCWGDFAGCCSCIKNCSWNNAVSDPLGMDYEGLYESKSKLIREELEKTMSGGYGMAEGKK